MTGDEHYAEAERLLRGIQCHDGYTAQIAAAQVHATLALAAACARATAPQYSVVAPPGFYVSPPSSGYVAPPNT